MAGGGVELYRRALKVALALLLLRSSLDLHASLNLVANLPGAVTCLALVSLSLMLLAEALSGLDLDKAIAPLAFTTLASFAASLALSMPSSPRYGSDAMLFTRYAIDLLSSGRNPYSCSMREAYSLYPIDYAWVTQTMEGGLVETYSYPSLSFLIYAPAVALGLEDVGLVQLSFFILMAALLLLETPKEYRPLPLLILLLDPSIPAISYAGTHDAVWALLFLVSMKFFNPRSSRELRLSAAALGLSMAVKQTPWLSLPFIVAWVYREAGRGEAVRYTLTALAAFLAPNAPFILWSPLDWTRGVLTPASQPLVPIGVGLVSLVYGGYIYLAPAFFTAATAAAAALLLALYWLRFEKLKPLAWVAPAFILFFAWRSLYNYFAFFIPIAYYFVLLKVKGRV
ncbi:MAG: hypothetical protein QXT74_03395 [Candidatus Nezhaarchaeales archaeon]